MNKLWLPVIGLLTLMIVGASLLVAVNAGAVVDVRSIAVAGDITVPQRNAVFRTLSDIGVSTTPIESVQQRLEARSWIQSVSVERRWPDVLQINVVPERPIALWNDDAYLNDRGEVFSSPFVNQSKLPQLYGPVGKEAQVMAQFKQLNATLFSVGQNIEVLALDDRFNWTLQSDSGIEVLLGKTALMERVQRLLKVTDHIRDSGRLKHIEQIDTRYGNGVAVAWKDNTDLEVASNYNSQREAKL